MASKLVEQERTLVVNGQEAKYYLRFNQQQKKIVLRIRNAEIHVSAPPYAPQESIENLIRTNFQKINQLKTKFEINNKYDLFTTKPWIKVFDQKINLLLVDENIHPKVTSDGIRMKNYHDLDEQLKKIYSFLGQVYKNWFFNQAKQYAQLMGLTFSNLTVKNLIGKWGACYPREKKLVFNARLLHFAPTVIDCVIVHELAHLVNPNHSRQFWNLVYQYQPNYQQISLVLDNWGI